MNIWFLLPARKRKYPATLASETVKLALSEPLDLCKIKNGKIKPTQPTIINAAFINLKKSNFLCITIFLNKFYSPVNVELA